MTRSLQNLSRNFAGPALLAIVFLCFPTAVSAVSLPEYQQRLKEAIRTLEKLGEYDDQQQLNQTTTTIRNTLPENLTVESKGHVYNVSNSWLYEELRKFETASASQRGAFRSELIERLRAIDERVTELDEAKEANGDSKTEADRKLAEILSRSEYATRNKQGQVIFKYIERFFNWLWQFFPQRSLKQGSVSRVTLIAEIVVIGIALAVLIFVAVKLIRHFSNRNRSAVVKKKKKEPKIILGERLEPDASATDLLAEAEALSRKGEIRAAIRKAYIALLVELGDRKVISLAQHKTNRDYLRSVKTHPSLYRNMSGLTESFERHWYGFAQSTANDWQAFRAGYLEALRTND